MIGEIIDALEEYFKDEEDILSDCLMYLNSCVLVNDDIKKIKDTLYNHERCNFCGTKLAIYHYKEPHDIGDGHTYYEVLTDEYCPNCDGLKNDCYEDNYYD